MSKRIVNLLFSEVVQQVETILDDYPYHPYQQAFSIPDLRQKLISYVLSRVPGVYTVLDDIEDSIPHPGLLHTSPEQQQHLEDLIRRGIQQLLEDNSDWVKLHIPQRVNANLAPSSWFG